MNRPLLLVRSVVPIVVGAVFFLLPVPGSSSTVEPILTVEDFEPIVAQGFGDEQNSMAWSSRWWNGKLYVGTLRCNYCVQEATIARWLPKLSFVYPPADPEYDCTELPEDLPVRAEIWRWTPDSATWDLLLRSPEDVEIPGSPGKMVARDIGFRTMALLTEQDGTQALYVGALSAEPYLPGLPPARLLRSTDGESFAPVPQDPGTFLAEMTTPDGYPFNGFRSLQTYDGRLFGVASWGFAGHGSLIESATPQSGNDSFHYAAPLEQAFYQLADYNGQLYAASAAEEGFELLKTDAEGIPPYDFVTIIPEGGYLADEPSMAVVSLHEYNGRLYVGTDQPAEVYRVNPDETWELVAGRPRHTPDGFVRPLSGLGSGFDNEWNLHIWRMQDAWGTLYTGTMDQSTKWYGVESLLPISGFDLFATRNGYYYTMVTRAGFDTIYDMGLRQFAFSPEHGLVIGTLNNYYGTTLWRGLPDTERSEPPQRLEVARAIDSTFYLSWEEVPAALAYHIYRSDVNDDEDRTFRPIGHTVDRFFHEPLPPKGDQVAHYYVVAELAPGVFSAPSNITRLPYLGEVPTFPGVRKHLEDWNAANSVLNALAGAGLSYRIGSYPLALAKLRRLKGEIEGTPDLLSPNWRAEDAIILLDKLIRRVELADLGLASGDRLD